jgi:hypothetical protein
VVSQERHPNPAPIPPAQVPADPASHEQDPVGRAALISPEGEELGESDYRTMLDFMLARLKNDVSPKTLRTFLNRLRRNGPQ